MPFSRSYDNTSELGGLFLQNEAYAKAVNELSVWAESVGADTLILEESSKSFVGSWATGTAYRSSDKTMH